MSVQQKISHFSAIKEKIDIIETEVKDIMWPESEKNMKETMLSHCAELKQSMEALTTELNADKERAFKEIMTKAQDIETIMFNRGRYTEIKRIIG